jgi:hypothetical protein
VLVAIFDLEIEHRLVHVLAPSTADETGVNSSGDGIRVICVDAGSPECSPCTDLLAVRLVDAETRNPNGESAILTLLKTRKRPRSCGVTKFGAIHRGSSSRSTNTRGVQC